ncbi:hypothetical protein BT69DRAFT_1246530 [Atractiella rhizophila]|nr:hypothetical protein BT69DRAFT_1246530 [Atractiella rhizophila]
MRFLSLLPLLSLFSIAAAATLTESERLLKFSTLARKNNGLIPLNDETYDELTAAPRNYSVSVLLTALSPQFQCAPCRQIDPEIRLLAKSWAASPSRDQHFFGILDFNDGREIYRRLNLQNAPTFQLFLPTHGPRSTSTAAHQSETLDLQRSGLHAEALAYFIQNRGGLKALQFQRPKDYTAVIMLTFMGTGLAIGAFMAWDILMIIIGYKWLWATGIVATILQMVAGHMWNQIRHPPYFTPTRDGSINYIAGGYSNQFGVETHIVSALYGCLAFTCYTLAITLPKIPDRTRQRVGIYLWTLILMMMFGVLMQLFRKKNPGYPFRLLF